MYRYQGEWCKMDCRVKNRNVNATLWKSDKPKRKITVDGKRLKMSDNIFNITNLTSADTGYYHCEVCGISQTRGELEVMGSKSMSDKRV